MHIKSMILAVDQGENMKSKKVKVLHQLLGKPLISYPVEVCKAIGSEQIQVIVGEQWEDVTHALGGQVDCVLQEDGIAKIIEFAQGSRDLVVLNGDAPLITQLTLERLLKFHHSRDKAATILSAKLNNLDGYKQIIRGDEGEFLEIAGQESKTDEKSSLKEVDSGIYVFKTELLKSILLESTKEGVEGYHPENIVKRLIEGGYTVEAMVAEDAEDVLRVNSRSQLAAYTAIMKKRINEKHMDNGVTLEDPLNTYIESDVMIGQDTIIEPNCILKGNTQIGSDCFIGYNTNISNTQIANGVHIENSKIVDSFVDDGARIGPFAYIRPQSKIGKGVKIGDFVEIKNSKIGDYTSISHLTYVGDADVGKHVNFGCGSVLVNYDSVNKHRSVIEDYAFIGCNTNLVSPVHIGERAYTAAGSTITVDVPKESLGISRAKQVNKEGWVAYKYPKD